MSNIEDRLDRLESLVEQQQETIEQQRETIEQLTEGEQGANEPSTPDESGGITPTPSRRTALKAGGLLALLGFGASASSAAPTGEVGSTDRPLNALYTQAIRGDPGGTGPLEVFVGGDRALSIGKDDDVTGVAGNLVAGHASNGTAQDVVGATVAGGGRDDGTVNASHLVRANYGTIGGGENNTVGNDDGDPTTGTNATVGGGITNSAVDQAATVSGGSSNTANGVGASVGGGQQNEATADNATVSGGESNLASTGGANVGGGQNNAAYGYQATVAGGGDRNDATRGNTAHTNHSTVGGGANNDAGTGNGSDITGAIGATVAGGTGNSAEGTKSTVSGGENNSATANLSTIGGGQSNVASGNWATVPGGSSNEATGETSFAAGSEAKATNDGSFVWGDSTTGTVESSAADQFIVQATGGVGIGTTAPSVSLEVDGDANTTGTHSAGSLDVSGAASADSLTVTNGTSTGDLDVSGTIRRDAMTQVYLASNTIPSSTETTLEFSRELVDEPGAWDTGNYEYTCPADGHYQVKLNILFGALPAGTTVTLTIKDGGGGTRYAWTTGLDANDYYERTLSTTITNMSANGVITFTIEQDSGSDQTLTFGITGTRADIRYLGDGTN